MFKYGKLMNFKSIVLFFCSFFFALALFYPLMPATGPAQGAPSDLKLPPGMTEEDMKMFSEFIDSLDQETIDALTSIGEEIIKEAEEAGMDPFEYIEQQAQMQKEYEDIGKKDGSDKTKKAQEDKKSAQAITIDAQTVQEILKDISRIIPEIIQKASSDINLSNELLPFKYRFDDLVYYATKLSDDKYLKHLSDPEQKKFTEDVKSFHKELSSLNYQYVVPEFSLEGENQHEILGVSISASPAEIVTAYDKISKITDPDMLELQLIKDGKTDQQIKTEVETARKRFDTLTNAYEKLRAKEEALFILNRILDLVTLAIDTNKLIEESKKIVAKYDPEAEKVKKEQEKIETDARKKQDEFIKKRPITTRSFSMPPASKKYKKSYGDEGKKYGGYDDYDYGYKPSKDSARKGFSGLPKSGKSDSGKKSFDKKDDKKKEDKDKKDKKDKKPFEKGEKGKADKKSRDEKQKKAASNDVSIALGMLESEFNALKKLAKENAFSEGEALKGLGLVQSIATPLDKDPKVMDEQKKQYRDLIAELTAKFNTIAGFIKKTLDKKLKNKPDDQKKFKEEAEKLFKKFEESDVFMNIAFLFKEKVLNAKSTAIMGIKTRGLPDIKIDAAKRDFLLTDAQAPKDDKEKPIPYIELLRDAYKKAQEKVISKKDDKKIGLPPSPTAQPALLS